MAAGQRRTFLLNSMGAAAAVWGGLPRMVHAQAGEYPNRPMRVVVPTPPGQGSDIGIRALGKQVQELTGQPFVVDNLPGGNQVIGARAVLRSPPDGYTMFVGSQSSMAGNAAYLKDLGYDAVKDFTPVAALMRSVWACVVSGQSEFRTAADLFAAARRNPDMRSFGINGSSYQMGAILLGQAVGVPLNIITYKGAPQVVQDVAGRQIAAGFAETSTVTPLVASGRLRALFVMSDKRLPHLPDVPTAREAQIDVPAFFSWMALFAPANTPKPLRDKLAGVIDRGMRTEEFVRFLTSIGFENCFMDPDRLAQFQVDEIAKYRLAMKVGNLLPQ